MHGIRKEAEHKIIRQPSALEVTAKLTAEFNLATRSREIMDALLSALEDLGYQYLSTWVRYGERLYWDRDMLELPGWLMKELPQVVSKYLGERRYNFWVPLNSENIYSRCYLSQTPQSSASNKEIIEPLYLGEIAFENLPDWIKRAADQLLERLDVRKHNAFPIGEYGMLFLSNPHKADTEESKTEEHKGWVEVILQQAEVALARTQAVESLKESEARYRALFERTNDSVFILDLDLVHIDVNQQAADMLGYSLDELIGLSAEQIVAPEEWQDMKAMEGMLRQGDIPPIYRRTYIKKDGSRLLAEVSVAMAYNQEGVPSHFQSVARNITERVRTQEELGLQVAALEAAANGIVITDIGGTILWVNPAVTTLTGYSAEELIGKKTNLLNSGEQRPAFFQELWDTILSGEVWHGELVNKRKDGSHYTEEMTITPVRSSQGEITRFIAVKQDVSQQALAKELLQFLATHDPLTRLPNRTLFHDRLSHAISRVDRAGRKAAVLFIDLDDFKAVNDEFGHEMGDLLLGSVAVQLLDSVRASDTVARLGGDEFVIVLEDVGDQNDVIQVVNKLLAEVSQSFAIKGEKITISCSIGISLYPDDSQTPEGLLKFADQALYSVKESGKNNYQFYP